ncbi:MAG TPA: IS701 family transposase [Ktedonobacterales bacterium]|nr:IS701 family transposase [Ktedonobacterales bacterium]
MTTAEQSEALYASELQVLSQAAEALDEVQTRIGPRFRRAETRRRVRRFLEGLLAPVERKNGWQLAEAAGERGPHGVQRLLLEADWDQEAVRDELRAYVLGHLGEEAGILVVDETGFLKKGKKSAGVARQYSGTAGRRENSQIGVFLLYAGRKGAAFIDRELYLPKEWALDRVRCREAGIPERVGSSTKGELARAMLARAFAAGVRAAWVVGDTIYGSDELRTWLEQQRQAYVLAVAETQPVWVAGQAQPVGLIAALLPEEAWTPLSAGEGSQGPRLYDWAWLEVDAAPDAQSGWRSWILIRRSLSDSSKRAYYRVWEPPQLTLAALVQVAGRRWTIEEGIEEAKGEVGLDHYEVRAWRGWYRHITLALLAHAILVVLRAQAEAQAEKGALVAKVSG